MNVFHYYYNNYNNNNFHNYYYELNNEILLTYNILFINLTILSDEY